MPKSCNAINTFNKCLLKRFAAQKFPISSGCGKGLRKSYVMAFFLSLLRCTKSLKILCHDNNIPTRQGLSLVSSSNACRSISGIKWKKKESPPEDGGKEMAPLPLTHIGVINGCPYGLEQQKHKMESVANVSDCRGLSRNRVSWLACQAMKA